MNFASQIGKALGAIYGGIIILRGRKKVFLIFNILSILSTALTLILNYQVIVAAKFLQGFFVPVVHIRSITTVHATAPSSQIGRYGTIT